MNRSKRVLSTIFAALAVLSGPVFSGAQTSTGTVIGTVTDPSGGGISGATVTLTSKDTGAVRTAMTTPVGTYRIESVPPGTFDISASATGFETTVNKGLVVPGTTIVTANISLKVGQASSTIEVLADNAEINTDNGQIDQTIGSTEINNLPINSLSPYELVLTLPGAEPDTQGVSVVNGVDFEVGGGRPRANNFLIEGQDNNDAGLTGQGLQPENIEAVEEVKVIETGYTAEFGHGAGSVSNFILKSGTNQLHGAVYERLTNNSLDAVDKQDHFNGVTQVTKYRENFPGFRIGGPIIRNKLFGFASYQWDFYRSSANLNVLDIPTAAGLATLKAVPSNPYLTRLLTAYGPLVGTLNPLNLQPSIALGPDPTTGVDRGTVQIGTVQRNLGADDNAPEMDFTGDYIASSKDTFRFHLMRGEFIAPYDTFNDPGQLPGFDTDVDGRAYNAGIAETHLFNTHLVNELRISYGRIGFTFGLPASTLANPLYDQPAVSIPNIQGYGIPDNVPDARFHNTYQIQDTLSWTRGQHLFKFGADVANIRVRDLIPFIYYGSIGYSDDVNATPVGEGSFTYKGLGNYIDDFGGAGNVNLTQNFGSPTARPDFYSQNYFAEDTWRPMADLSIDYGFRYEFNGAPFNTTPTPYPGIDESQIGCFPTKQNSCNSHEQPQYSEWGPRVGIAYSPEVFGQHKSVVRASFGVFYDVLFTNIIDNIQATAPAAASPTIYTSASATKTRGTSSWYQQFANLNPAPLASNLSEPILNHLQYPRNLHWNLDLEQELPWATSVQISYVGERGEHLYGNTNLNPFINDYFYADRIYPNRGQIVVRDNSGDSEYNALWAQLDHKISHNFEFRAAYTWSKMMDDSSEVFTLNNESSYQFSRYYQTPRGLSDWGPSSYDHRQRLVLSYVWEPQVWHTEGAMKVAGNIVNHWVIAGITQFQSGTPENVEVGYDVDGDGISNDRPMLSNPKAPINTYAWDDSWFYGVSDGGLCSGPSLWYTDNPCEVVTPSQVHWIVPAYGTYPAHPVSRNSLFAPGYQKWDVNVSREFPLFEKATLSIRGEFFNIFNHGLLDGNGGVENTTLTTGIVTDAYTGDNGTNIFYNPAPAIDGHRQIRVVARIQF